VISTPSSMTNDGGRRTAGERSVRHHALTKAPTSNKPAAPSSGTRRRSPRQRRTGDPRTPRARSRRTSGGGRSAPRRGRAHRCAAAPQGRRQKPRRDRGYENPAAVPFSVECCWGLAMRLSQHRQCDYRTTSRRPSCERGQRPRTLDRCWCDGFDEHGSSRAGLSM
jgi:hypothetical protein